jgi:multicomponent Na+:H+ antiporter subunit G
VSVLAIILILSGLFFLAVSAFGLLRFPDFYTRAHVVAKSETLGVILVISGIMVHHRFGEGTWRLVLLLAFAMVANPTAIHALSRAAHSEDPNPHTQVPHADGARPADVPPQEEDPS